MDRYQYVAVLILCSIVHGSSTADIGCKNSGTCFCSSEDINSTEFQCPNETSTKIVIQFQSEPDVVVEVQCIDKINWHTLDLPLVEIGDVDYFKFQGCPPPTNVGEIAKKLGVNNTKEFQFNYSQHFPNYTLTADYFEGLQNVTILELNYDDIRNIKEDTFTSLNKLVHLDLNHNQIKLSQSSFKHLSKLKSLHLADNELSELPSKIFENLTELTMLYLWSNRLTTISNDTFENLRNLEIIELRGNQLKNLTQDVFYYLQNLTIVGLSINELESLPENLFINNRLLERVNLERNRNLRHLPNNLFANLTKLKQICLNNCKLVNLSYNLFDGSISLQNIFLSGNKIEAIPEYVFKDLQQLEKLDLSYNKIVDLPDEVFSSLSQLKTLNLEENFLTNITGKFFSKLKSLEELNLRHNKINVIEKNSFHTVSNLKEIILANNCFDLPENGTLFYKNHKLRKVDLSNNNITRINNNFLSTHNLEELDLSYNHISSISFNDVFIGGSSSLTLNLAHNKISIVNFDRAEEEVRSQKEYPRNIKVHLNGNPIECNCYTYNFVRYLDGNMNTKVKELVTIEADQLNCSSRNDFMNVPVTEVKPYMLITCSLEQLGIKEKFTENCSYGVRQWDKSLIVNCTNSNFNEVPELRLPSTTKAFFNQTEVYLRGNLITSGPKENMGYENITKLDLSFNKITEITWIPPNIQVLKLNNNSISYINHDVFRKLNLSHLTNLTLGNNPWNCNCSTVKVITFLKSNVARQRLQIDTYNIWCREHKGKLMMDLNAEDICPTNTTLILVLGITFSLIALSIAVLVALYYRFHHEVKVWLFAHRMFLWLITEDEIDKDKLFDAFISYSHQDEEFVVNELLPVLEQGPRPYKLCIHIRNWIAGEFISKQIATSVAESRRTLIILSRNFLQSEWGKMEFRTAHKQAMEEGRARVILILYGDIDVTSDLDEELKAYVRTNTYVKWGDTWFWDKLRYALPHSRVEVEEKSQKSQNIMVAINEGLEKLDKLDLANGKSIPPNSGPIDARLLKNNLLNLSPGQEGTSPTESGLNSLVITM